MKKDRIINPELIAEIAKIGHTDFIVIGDAGLPVPDGVKCIDLSLVHGIPKFMQVLKAVKSELVIESYVLAEEMKDKNPENYKKTNEMLGDLPHKEVSHEELKEMSKKSKAIIRTGEVTSFSNIILVAGVNF